MFGEVESVHREPRDSHAVLAVSLSGGSFNLGIRQSADCFSGSYFLSP